MQFRTAFNQKELTSNTFLMDYSSKIGLIGSCFVENIGEKLSYYKFDTWVNPYGILFNPIAIEKMLSDIYSNRKYTKEDLVFEGERYHSLHHHSDFSDKDAKLILEKINTGISKIRTKFQKTTHLIITLGTAWIYEYTKTKEIVANCHKIPQKAFSKRILSTEEISRSLKKIISTVHKLQPNLQIIITLSPVRHLKDGMVANSRSKAQLLTAIHQVIDKQSVTYFPSYEIMLDDLREYRFYTKDMLHPNEMAIDYIWEIFKQKWIYPKSFSIMEDVATIQKGKEHRPFDPNSIQHRKFLQNLDVLQENLKKEYGISF